MEAVNFTSGGYSLYYENGRAVRNTSEMLAVRHHDQVKWEARAGSLYCAMAALNAK